MRISVIILLVCLTNSIFAQILDDSTELVYSAKTTKIIYEKDIKNNKVVERHPDTTLYKIESWMITDRSEHRYQDLGNNGSPLNPVFYPISEDAIIGKTTGYTSFDPYMIMPDDIRYLDTKSPYINVTTVFGGNRRSIVDFTFARSVDENWSFGFDIHKITSDKQIGFTSIGDRSAQATVFSIYSNYQHHKLPYHALFNAVIMNHNFAETGGILVADNATQAELFLFQDSRINLTDANSKDSRVNFHLYHEYEWRKQLQIYHQLDIRKQENTYNDAITANDESFYGGAIIDGSLTRQASMFREVINEAGLQGDLASLFYRVYVKRRDFDFGYLYWDPISKSAENYLGGYSRFTWRDKFDVEAQGEYLQTGEYKLIGKLNSDLIFGSYSSVRAKAPIFYERYFGNHHQWSNSLDATFTNEIKGGVKLSTKFLTVKPTARVLSLSNLIYLDEEQTPQQAGALAVLTSIGGNVDLRIPTSRKHDEAIFFENEVFFNNTSGGAASSVPVPQIFYNGRLFWRGAWFKKTMHVEVGTDLFARTGYYGMDYSPALQHYHLQNDFELESYYTADFFVNMKVSNVTVFVKWMYLNQQQNDGYFTAPFYPGEQRAFDLGVNWKFYD